MIRKIGGVSLLLLLTTAIYAQLRTISGYITDGRSSEPLIAASLYEEESAKGAVSNYAGYYSITLPQGEVSLRYSYVGYTTTQHAFTLTRDTVINIRLQSATELDEVVVSATRRELGVQGSQMGAIEVPIEQIKTVPTLFGEADLIKALQLLPGVQSGTEGSAGMYVRGGGPDENLLLIDGVPVYNVNHLFGFFSVFNPDAVKTVTLYKGNFPARFGGRLSSVVDIRLNDGDMKEYHGNVSVGLISAKFNVEGPIIKDKLSFNISGRRTYGDVLIQPALWISSAYNGGDERVSAGYYFYDLNAKLTYKISDKDRLILSHYMGDDVIYASMRTRYRESFNYRETMKTKMNWKWGNIVTALRWNRVIAPKLFMNSSLNYTQYRYNLGLGNELKFVDNVDARNNLFTEFKLNYKSGIRDGSAKVDFDYSPTPNHDIKFGGGYTFHQFRPDVQAIKLTDSSSTVQNLDTIIGDPTVLASEMAFYIEDNMTIGSVFKVNLGLHYSTFAVQNKFYHSLQPRVSMRALITPTFSFKAGYAYMNQYIHLLSNSSISLPTDLWVPVTARIKPMSSQQVSAGFYYELANLFDLSVEGYYKTMHNIIEYKDGASFWGNSTGWEDKVSMGRGWAYGVEFLAQRSFGKTTGWIGYTWSKSERLFNRKGEVINKGMVFPAKYDRRHDVSITLSHKFSKKIDVAATWVYSTGNSGTLALHQYPALSENGGQNIIDHVSSRNNYRLNPYHRLDIGVNFHKQYKKFGSGTWSVSVYNVYNQNNPFMVYTSSDSRYDATTNSHTTVSVLKQLSIFPILPSVSYTFRF